MLKGKFCTWKMPNLGDVEPFERLISKIVHIHQKNIKYTPKEHQLSQGYFSFTFSRYYRLLGHYSSKSSVFSLPTRNRPVEQICYQDSQMRNQSILTDLGWSAVYSTKQGYVTGVITSSFFLYVHV